MTPPALKRSKCPHGCLARHVYNILHCLQLPAAECVYCGDSSEQYKKVWLIFHSLLSVRGVCHKTSVSNRASTMIITGCWSIPKCQKICLLQISMMCQMADPTGSDRLNSLNMALDLIERMELPSEEHSANYPSTEQQSDNRTSTRKLSKRKRLKNWACSVSSAAATLVFTYF